MIMRERIDLYGDLAEKKFPDRSDYHLRYFGCAVYGFLVKGSIVVKSISVFKSIRQIILILQCNNGDRLS